MNETNGKVKLADALRAEAAALEAQAAAKRAQAEALTDDQRDERLTIEAVREHYGWGREAIRAAAARGDIEVHRGPRGQLLVLRSSIEAWIAARPYKPPARRASNVVDLGSWEAEQERELGRAGGNR